MHREHYHFEQRVKQTRGARLRNCAESTGDREAAVELVDLDGYGASQRRVGRSGEVDLEVEVLQSIKIGIVAARIVAFVINLAQEHAGRTRRRLINAVQTGRWQHLEAKLGQRRHREALQGGRQAGQHACAVNRVDAIRLVGAHVVGIRPHTILGIVRKARRDEVVAGPGRADRVAGRAQINAQVVAA